MKRSQGMLLRWAVAGIPACLAALWPAPCAAATVKRESQYVNEQQSLESARYLFEIEGDAAGAYAILDGLEKSDNPAVQVQVQYLRGLLLEEEGKTAEALPLYTRALGGEGLSPVQKQRLIARLLVLNPAALQPLRTAGKARGLPSRVFTSPAPEGGDDYVLLENADRSDGPLPRLSWQNSEGLLKPMRVDLQPDEEVLDATPDKILTRLPGKQRTLLREAPQFLPVVLNEKFPVEEGFLFGGETGEALLIGSQGLRLMRRSQLLFSHPLPAAGCSYLPSSPRSKEGVLFCPGQALYRADFNRRSLTPLPLGGDTPSEVVLSGEYLAIRYNDHMEIRRGPAFDTFLWGFPSGSQDQLAISRGHAFLAAADGPLRAFVLRTGQLDWQREEGVSSLRADGGELFALTHSRACIALDEKGRPLFSYEVGWGEDDPLLLPSRKWLTIQYADGSRVRLNRELLRLTGGNRDYLFQGVRDDLARRDARGALRELDDLLALEPGNGIAWKEKARILAATGAPRADQTNAWLQAARAQGVSSWSRDPALEKLAANLGASWIWKRLPGPRFFPTLTSGRQLAFYLENDNQTLVVLDGRTGALRGNFRFPEPLDLKVAAWSGDTLIVSSTGHLYWTIPLQGPGILTQLPLRNPICQALTVPQGLLYSDWNGNLQLLDLASRRPRWEVRLGHSGLLLARGGDADHADAFEIEGVYHQIQLSNGRSLAEIRLPPGTVTETHSGREFAFAGYNEGLIVAINRAQGAIAWQKDMGEQIFSLSGRDDQVLLVGTASKRIVNLQGRTGIVQSQAQIPTYLFNRPLVVEDGYWVGTTEPALEKRSFSQVLLKKLPLTGMPGTPTLVGSGIAISTLDNFILCFPAR